MKAFVLVLAAVITVCSAGFDPRCAWGPSHWCSGLDVARSCGAVEHCRNTVWKNQMLKQDGTDTCTFCEAIVEDARKYLEQGKTEKEISKFLASACAIVPESAAAAKCKLVAETMIKEVLQLITSSVEPQMICSLLGVCSGLEDSVLHSPMVVKSPSSAVQIMGQIPVTSAERKLSPLVGIRDEPICTDCKKFFNDVKQIITSNKTEEEAEQIIDQAICSQLGSLEKECKALIHEYLSEILHMLAMYYDPAVICSALGVCKNDNPDMKYKLLFTRLSQLPLYKSAATQNSASTCLMCEAVMEELQVLDRDEAVQKQLVDMIKSQFCSRIGSMKDVCELTVTQYSKELFEMLATILEPTTRCQSLGFCDAVSNAIPPVNVVPGLPITPAKTPINMMPGLPITPAKDPSPLCVVCEMLVKEIKQLISDNVTEAEILKYLEEACSQLPESLSKTCKDFVDTYAKMVIDLLIHEVDPEKVCIQLHLCNETKGNAMSLVPGVPITPAKQPSYDDNKLEKDPSPLCVVCELVVKEIKQLIGQNASEEEIMQSLEKACSLLPESLAKNCKDFVDTYAKIVIEMLIHEIDPEKVCIQLNLCDGSKGNSVPKVPVGNTEVCAVCETVVQYLEALLEQGSTTEQIEALLDKLCGYLPASIANQCEDLVKQYGDLIIHYVSTLASPKEVCSLIRVCKEDDIQNFMDANRSARVARESGELRPEIEERVQEKPEFKRNVPKLGENECTWGPRHWCSSLELATKCKKLDYCRGEVWGKDEP